MESAGTGVWSFISFSGLRMMRHDLLLKGQAGSGAAAQAGLWMVS